MANKWKVKGGKKYLWDTFANKWSFRGNVGYPVADGEYKDKIPAPEAGTRASQSQVPELSDVLAAPYQAAMAGVTKVGEAVSRPIMQMGEAGTRWIKEAAQQQFPQREENTIVAPTAGQKLMAEGQQIARSVMDVSTPMVTRPPREPEIQINPKTTWPKPSITITPPTKLEEAVAKLEDIGRADAIIKARGIRQSVPSQMEQEVKNLETSAEMKRAAMMALNVIKEKPWLGNGYTVEEASAKLDTQIRELTEMNKQADAIQREIDALVASEPKPNQPKFKAPRIESAPKFTDEELRETQTERKPGAQNYADEYRLRYQKAMAGNYGTR
jgi:hypothetical protein